MNETKVSSQITLRIPAAWPHPGELLERLPGSFQLTPDALVLPDGSHVEFTPMPPDEAFPEVFVSACRRPPSRDELEVLAGYTVNIALSGPGGSLGAALKMMQAGAAIVRAGGAGVFIDNSALAHGGADWVAMTDDAGLEAITFAFASIVRGRDDLYTVGMQTLGSPDLLMRRADLDEQCEALVEIIHYICGSEQPVGDGHLLADEMGPRFKVLAAPGDTFDARSPMHNPFGRLRIVSFKDIAEGN